MNYGGKLASSSDAEVLSYLTMSVMFTWNKVRSLYGIEFYSHQKKILFLDVHQRNISDCMYNINMPSSQNPNIRNEWKLTSL